MPGSGINAKTVIGVLNHLLPHGLKEIHLSGGIWVDGGMLFRREGMGMGASDSEWGVWRTDQDTITAVKTITDAFNAK